MLGAIRERAQGWIAKLILVLITVPFALWGVDSYFKGSGKEPAVATVGKEAVGQHEFFRALQNSRAALQARTHTKIDIENKAFRKTVLDQLINERLMSMAGSANGLIVPTGDLNAVIENAPIFQVKGKFSRSLFQTWLRRQGMDQRGLLRMIQQNSMARQFQVGYGQGAIVPIASVKRVADLLVQQREINEAKFETNDYTKGITIDDKAVETEYNAHKKDYAIPEQVKVRYLVLSAKTIKSDIKISDQAARQYYEANKQRYREPERRHASHILIKVDSSMSAAQKAAAKAKAEKIYQELLAHPGKFAEFAKKYSQDPGSAAKGGDLGTFTRETMVKPFSNAVFSMKVGELHSPVETRFGYHIIRLDGIEPGKVAPFDSVKAGIVAGLAKQEAARKFAKEADKFSNVVYEQSDSLAPAAKQFNLTVQESGWISREHAPPLLDTPKMMDALFSPDSIEQHENTEAIEVARDTLVSAHVIGHKPAGVLPLSEVAAKIRIKLTARAARAKAIAAGRQALERAQSGKAVSGFGAPMTVSRMNPLNLPPESIRAIFKVDPTKLPASVGVETPDGYRLYRITKVINAAPADARQKQLQAQLTDLIKQQQIKAYLDYERAKVGVEINEAILEKKED